MRAPCLIQSTLTITGEPADTFLDMTNWHKGIVFVNGFNIGLFIIIIIIIVNIYLVYYYNRLLFNADATLKLDHNKLCTFLLLY